MGVLRCTGIVEQVQEPQPSHCVAEESLACVRPRGPGRMSPAGQGPLLDCRLDPGHVDSFVFAQVEKTNQAGLMSHDRAQRLPPDARLCAMHEIAQPFLNERRGVVVGYGSATGKELLEHRRVSL